DIGPFPPEPLVDRVEQAVRLRLASLAQHGESRLALDQRTTVEGKIDGRIDIAAHEAEPGEKNAMVVGSRDRCQALVGMSGGKEAENGRRFEDRPAIVETERRNEAERRDLAEGRLAHLLWRHPDILIDEVHLLQHEMGSHRSPALDVVELI